MLKTRKNKTKSKYEANKLFFDTNKRNSTATGGEYGNTHTSREALITLTKGRNRLYFWLTEKDALALKKQLDELLENYGDGIR